MSYAWNLLISQTCKYYSHRRKEHHYFQVTQLILMTTEFHVSAGETSKHLIPLRQTFAPSCCCRIVTVYLSLDSVTLVQVKQQAPGERWDSCWTMCAIFRVIPFYVMRLDFGI